MKPLFSIFLMMISLNVFSQSYLIMENGIIITTDKSGYAYDLGHYAYPQKVTLRGGQYFVEEGNILATIDENGLLFRKYEQIPQKITGKGINYFISDDGVVYTINENGYLRIFESKMFKSAVNFGGNYFTVVNKDNENSSKLDMFVVNSKGEVLQVEAPGLNIQEIVYFGGNYFMNNRGFVFTVSTDGNVSHQKGLRVGIIQKRGGNFFVDSSGYFFTVSDNGDLLIPELPSSMKTNTILRLGSNYFIDQAGKFFIVNKDGMVLEKIMQDHDFRRAEIISL